MRNRMNLCSLSSVTLVTTVLCYLHLQSVSMSSSPVSLFLSPTHEHPVLDCMVDQPPLQSSGALFGTATGNRDNKGNYSFYAIIF